MGEILKPAAIAAHDIPGHRPDDLTHVRAQLAEVGTTAGAEDEQRKGSAGCKFCGVAFEWSVPWGPHGPRAYVPEDCGCKNRDPSAEDDEATVEALMRRAGVGGVPDPLVAFVSSDVVTVQRAAWDATLATIARLESRVGALESRADEAERLARGVGPRVASMFRRDRLRGGR